ncbi:MAG: bifunctional 5,10-methylenetetrahydrofolate dehydrogenase/5,10-methenyltetrahydrofolate cyclohydrolase [Clostridia bacterium]|nr:bifunctional 5,10-methylenetetrahydrofolate dehydrogenase/5,10-methenyltetrahydrofolate cyclohydrolase [Clostridia bacterium]
MIILDGKNLALKIKKDIKLSIEKNFFADGILPPKLAIVIVGSNPASLIYVANKLKACEYVGIKTELFNFEENVSEVELSEKIFELNSDNTINGILVQLPLPKHINSQNIINQISEEKDVDGLCEKNLGKLLTNNRPLNLGCTPSGIITLLKEYDINMVGKNVVIINRSILVGKPLTLMFLNENATVTVCHSKTKNLKEKTLLADIIVVGVGRIDFLKNNMIKKGAIVVDVGINRNENTNKIQGDVDFLNVSKKASYITPVPNGVGPMTIAMLLKNTFESTIKQNKKHL